MSSSSLKGTAVVTGASSGIGAVYAERLAGRGYGLILVARRADRLQDVAETIRARHGVEVRIEVGDLGTTEGLAQIETLVRSSDAALVVNNAGVGGLGQTIDHSADRLADVIQLNILALSRLSHAALEVFRTRGSGTLINIGSVIAFRPAAGGAAYSGSKAYVLNFTRSLQAEYADSDIRIQLVQPGPIRTEFFTAAGVGDDLFPPETFLSAEQLVDAALVGLDHGELVTTPSLADVTTWDDLEKQREAFMKAVHSGRVADRYRAWSEAYESA